MRIDRNLLREYAKDRRESLGEEREKYDRDIVSFIVKQDEYERAKHILAYAAIGSEVNLTELMKHAWKDGKKVYLPRCYPTNQQMEFYEINSLEQCENGHYGILEPRENPSLKWKGEENTLMIAPGVAFDLNRYRLGYGAGYYDRYLGRFPQLDVWMAAFSCQQVEDTGPLPTDVLMTKIITEHGEI